MRILLCSAAVLVTAACTTVAETSQEVQAQPRLNTPVAITATNPVAQDIVTTEQNVFQELEPAPSPEPSAAVVRADLDDLGLAPELVNEVWLNSQGALRLADLRGKVVLLEMWTFG